MDKYEITAAEMAEFQTLRVELRQRRVEDKVKSLGSIKADTVRKRIALRRIDINKEAPNEDLVAYDAIHKLKNPFADSKQKVTVSENEIVAYKVLDPDFNKTVTLAEVAGKVAELKGTGKLTAAGDNAGNGEDTNEEDA